MTLNKLYIYISKKNTKFLKKTEQNTEAKKMKKIGVLLRFRLICSSTGLSSLSAFSQLLQVPIASEERKLLLP